MAPGEWIGDFPGQNTVKRREVDHRRPAGTDVAGDGYFHPVEVPMVGRRSAGCEAVPGVKREGARQRAPGARLGHQAKPKPKRISGVAVYCDVDPVVLTAFGLAAVPGCCDGSRLYDTG